MINLIKLTHSIIWLFMAAACFYILYCGITGTFNLLLYISLGTIVFEIITLLLNNWACPLTNMAKKANPNWQDGDDIFLPVWIAKNNKVIFGTIITIGIILLLLRWLW